MVAGGHWFCAKPQNYHFGGWEPIVTPFFSTHKSRSVFAPQSLLQSGLPLHAHQGLSTRLIRVIALRRRFMLCNHLHRHISHCRVRAFTIVFLQLRHADGPPFSKLMVHSYLGQKELQLPASGVGSLRGQVWY